MENLIIRQDDFDFRLEPEEYIAIHEKFIEAGLTETAVLQFAQFGNVANFDPKLINYMKTAPNWDLQLHGWEHSMYSEMHYSFILRDMAAAMHYARKLFDVIPTVWYPPWNCRSNEMDKVAEQLGLKIDNESCDIRKFIREVKAGIYEGHSLYFHGWNKVEMGYFDEMIKYAKEVTNAPEI